MKRKACVARWDSKLLLKNGAVACLIVLLASAIVNVELLDAIARKPGTRLYWRSGPNGGTHIAVDEVTGRHMMFDLGANPLSPATIRTYRIPRGGIDWIDDQANRQRWWRYS